MKIISHREALLAAFQTAAAVVPGRTPKPVLQNVKIEATGDAVTLIATDMEVGIRIEVPQQHAEVAGSALLSVQQFGSILRESGDSVLQIEADGHAVSVRGEHARFKLPSGNPAEFPDVSGFQETDSYVIPSRLLKELIRRTLFATDNESSRYALGGVLLEFDNDRITAVSTDGRRLAKMEGPLASQGNPVQTDAMTIVPSRSMQLIERALVDPEASVHLATRANDFLVRCPTATIITRLVEGRFPRWRDVLPHRPEAITLTLTVGPLHSALRQAAIVTSSESRGIDFAFGNGQLVLSGLTADVGESHVELPIAYDGPEIVVCLDYRFVIDFLRVLEPERAIRVNLVDGDGAVHFETDDGYGYVVMPLARDRSMKTKAKTASV
jgi:DNA polymerase-3 subunit beta